MYSAAEIESQRRAMLVKNIEYLRELKLYTEMTVADTKTRDLVSADIVSVIKRCGQELGGRHEEEVKTHELGGGEIADESAETGC